MNRLNLLLILSGLILIAGCENAELIQCQQEKQLLEPRITQLEEELQSERSATGQILTALAQENDSYKKQIEALSGELDAEDTKVMENRRNDRMKLEESLKTGLAAQQYAKELQNQLTQLRQQLTDSQALLQAKDQALQVAKAQLQVLKARLAESAAP